MSEEHHTSLRTSGHVLYELSFLLLTPSELPTVALGAARNAAESLNLDLLVSPRNPTDGMGTYVDAIPRG